MLPPASAQLYRSGMQSKRHASHAGARHMRETTRVHQWLWQCSLRTAIVIENPHTDIRKAIARRQMCQRAEQGDFNMAWKSAKRRRQAQQSGLVQGAPQLAEPEAAEILWNGPRMLTAAACADMFRLP